jgi:hypothetical protein
MTDYSTFPYNCEDCGHMFRCNHHDLVFQLEQLNDTLLRIELYIER